jgi:peptidoglycan hydrolase-like protein with peptidoglycan-binding domain
MAISYKENIMAKKVYSKVWFNTPSQTTFARSTPAQIRQFLQKFGIKPDGIIGPKVRDFLSNQPPIKLTQRLRYRAVSLEGLFGRKPVC